MLAEAAEGGAHGVIAHPHHTRLSSADMGLAGPGGPGVIAPLLEEEHQHMHHEEWFRWKRATNAVSATVKLLAAARAGAPIPRARSYSDGECKEFGELWAVCLCGQGGVHIRQPVSHVDASDCCFRALWLVRPRRGTAHCWQWCARVTPLGLVGR